MIENDDPKEKTQDSARLSEKQEKQEVMCWKDPNKVCSCERPQAGVFCGGFPFPTD